VNALLQGFRVIAIIGVTLACLSDAGAQSRPETEHSFLLVAHPEMLDLNFAGTVVLVMRPDDDGPLGVILNRPTGTLLSEIYPERAELQGRTDMLFFGGPVQPDALLFAFRSASKPAKGVNVADDIYISGFSGVLDELLQLPENATEQRFFAGYAGWARGQLEAEIAQGGWHVLPLDTSVIFEMNPLTLYDQLLRRANVPLLETGFPATAARQR
jgi:putative transcriptional regulator